MEHKVRFGIMSTAAIAKDAMIPAIRRADHAEVVAIASESGKASQVARELGIPKAYDNYEQLLDDPDIDAVYIPLPNSLHAEWTIKAAKKKKHVLCEKPAALCEEDVRRMIEACGKNGVLFMEAFMYQFHPQHERVKQLLAAGEIGDIKYMRAHFSFYLQDRETNIRMNHELGGGSLFDVGCYCVHSTRHILDAEPIELFVQSYFDPHRSVDLTTNSWMRMENGVLAQFTCSFDMFPQNEYEVVGTKGKIVVSRAYRPDVNEGEGRITVVTDDGNIREETVPGDQYTLQIEHFSRGILEGLPLLYSSEQMIKQARALDACRTSMETGNIVRL
ncbi:oxidoreductase [Geobacillus sp. 47C-IIb]|jgi:xylose dehydrogenase (NAD/NADP)|uniref:Gfo/Idh/MocA family protein n=1 Tax=Geobacillus TaxID=129337 RepID=UPI0009BE880D|nr:MULTISPECIES: Gfo/Idh/MocA family oxidoreductase [Geobacillus]ATO35824.1 oxidoreductase [Geobacillus thermodenitrificans]NNU88363.1 Gfo/Idh/MocA family oxidoreductase [Geobacillus sp. MR]OQP08300.1 oxidoreductase [Geobacillus sp. 47C-IIb]QNU31495.1 Gfo/Idh/MocA family oxidoreductase [Geobacillus sp. 47C-IIb]